jgi:hypothetical protein
MPVIVTASDATRPPIWPRPMSNLVQMRWSWVKARRPRKKAARPTPTMTMSRRKRMEPIGLSSLLPRSLIQFVMGLKAHGYHAYAAPASETQTMIDAAPATVARG